MVLDAAWGLDKMNQYDYLDLCLGNGKKTLHIFIIMLVL